MIFYDTTLTLAGDVLARHARDTDSDSIGPDAIAYFSDRLPRGVGRTRLTIPSPHPGLYLEWSESGGEAIVSAGIEGEPLFVALLLSGPGPSANLPGFLSMLRGVGRVAGVEAGHVGPDDGNRPAVYSAAFAVRPESREALAFASSALTALAAAYFLGTFRNL